MSKKTDQRSQFTYLLTIPKKYGACKGFLTYKDQLLLICEKAILKLKRRKNDHRPKLSRLIKEDKKIV